MSAKNEEAEQRARAAIEPLQPLGDREELAEALHLLGWFLWRRGQNEEAEPLLRRAVAMAEGVDAPLVPRRPRRRSRCPLAERSLRRGDRDDRGGLPAGQGGRRRDGAPARVQQLPVDRVGIRVRPSAGDRGAARGDRAGRASRRGRQPRVAGGHACRQHRGARRPGGDGAHGTTCPRAGRGVGRRTAPGDPG